MHRVLIITGSSSRRSGGLFYSVKNLAKYLSKRDDVELQVLAYKDDFSETDSITWASVDLKYYRQFYNGVFTINLMSFIQKFSPTVIYQNGVWTSATMVVNRYLKTVNGSVKYIVAPRGMLDEWAMRSGTIFKNLLYPVYINKGLMNITSFHALNASEKLAIEQVSKSPIFVVPNAVSVSLDRLEKQGDFSRWLFLGRIHPKKGLLELIEAFARLTSEAARKVELLIVGWVDDSNYYKILQKTVRSQGLEERVKFLGEMYGQEKEDILRECDVFVLPSFSEGLPMAVLEAWDKGLVTLITKECNLSDAFSSDAAFEIGNNIERLEKDLSRFICLSRSEKLELTKNAHKLLKEKYSWESVSNQFIERVNNLC